MKYFVCNNARKLLGSSGHSRRHHEGSGDKERIEERDRRQGDREVDKMISGVEALNVSSDSTSTEVTNPLRYILKTNLLLMQ